MLSTTASAVTPIHPAEEDLDGGYLFAYFRGESDPQGEQVRFAVSSRAEPLAFTVLSNGDPVLTSMIGERGVRDPFLVRNELTGGFHLIATDLSIHYNDDWDRALRHGSRAIIVLDSPDLITWTGPRRVVIAPPQAGCAWAPEALLDHTRSEYIVVWSSTMYGDDDPGHNEESYPRVLQATTRDFRSFSSPRMYIDPGYSVIDTTFLRRDGVLHRFTKDERSRSASEIGGKHVFQESTTDDVLATTFATVAEGIGSTTLEQGEGPIAVNSPDGLTSYLLIDEFGGRGYVAFESADPATGAWTPVVGALLPPGARHGSLLPISRVDRERLLSAYPSTPTVNRD